MKIFRNFINTISANFTQANVFNLLTLFLFVVIFTVILSSKYFLFQSIVNPDNTSKKDVISPKTITVVDTIRTEQRKKEAYQRIEPILVSAEDAYIQNNFENLIFSIKHIRNKDISNDVKREELSTVLDISDSLRKNFVINYFINADDSRFELMHSKARKTLDNVLKEGVSEKDFERNNVNVFVIKHSDPNVTKNQIKVITGLLEQVIVPNMVIDEMATELARKNAVESVTPSVVTFNKGALIVSKGEKLTTLKRDALNKAGFKVMDFNWFGILSIFIFVSLGAILVLTYLNYFEKPFLTRSYLSIIATLSILVAVCEALMPDDWSVFLLPLPAFTFILAIFSKPRIAFMITTMLISVICVSMLVPSDAMSVLFLTALVSSILIAKIRYSRRFDLVLTGIQLAAVVAVLIVSMYLLQTCISDIDFKFIKLDILSGVACAILSGIFTLGIIPMIESTSKIITQYGLAELADHNQPLLKKLQFEAPGTYTHSLLVSTLSETAAEAIGANPVLARVGAFYHDIGKLKRPLFFIENQTYTGMDNPHATLNPRLSKMVITAHTKDGVDMAKEYGIPPVIQDFIQQHHGDSIASYFYAQALKEEGEENVKEDQFRYAGPKPSTKEIAILMLADAVESASRTLKDTDQEELDALIDKIIKDRLNDGQLSDSALTLKDLKIIAQVFSKIIRASRHQRIKYHENIIEELNNRIKQKKEQTTT